MKMLGSTALRSFLCLLFLASGSLPAQSFPARSEWPTYGGDASGQRYSSAEEITPANVAKLHPVWSYETHTLDGSPEGAKKAAFEATPVLLDDTLLLSTPFDQVIALDATTGQQRWRYDPHLRNGLEAPIYTSRGVAVWRGSEAGQPCSERVLLGTLDARLIAIDATTGKPCEDFGAGGAVDLRRGVATQANHPFAGYGVTSPPAVVGEIVIVGSTISDNQAVGIEPGLVRGYDVRTGRLVWSWDPLAGQPVGRQRTGAGNTWGAIAADTEHGIVYLPTGSASPDFYGGERPGANRDADSVVALQAATGKRLWSFQTVHHDLWDYDVAAEPLLFTWHGKVPALAVTTKTGMIFVLNRLTGDLLSPVKEITAPRSEIAGESVSATQPISGLPALSPSQFTPRPAGLGTPEGDRECAHLVRKLRYEGIFTPPSISGTLLFPGSLGGVNWGSAAFDPETGVLYANTNRLPFEVRLIPRALGNAQQIAHDPPWYYGSGSGLLLAGGLLCWFHRRNLRWLWISGLGAIVIVCGLIMEHHPIIEGGNRAHFGAELSEQRGTPFWLYRRPLVDAQGLPCVAAPWGTTTAVDLEHGRKVFEQPLGTLIAGRNTGTVGLGGPVVTKGGLIFTAASKEPMLRALDKRTGQPLWVGQLPAPAQATPMVYSLHGREFVVIAAGGHGGFGTPQGDSLVAFALP